jgi:hypothetical protein
MTTVAFDGHILACDSGAWSGGIADTMRKLRPIGPFQIPGEIALVAGHAVIFGELAYSLPLLEWLQGRAEKPKVPDEKLAVDYAVIVTTSLRVFCLAGNGTLLEMTSMPFSIGGGKGVALGAMMHGANAVRAIEYAAERTDCALLPVQSVKLG